MRKSSLVMIGLFILIYILPLGVRPIFLPDEFRYAEIPREMLDSSDWVVPHLNGLRYFEKPVLGYWLNAISMILFGENAFSIRFPSALVVGISGLMIFYLVRRFADGYLAGIFSAAVFLTFIEVFAVGSFSVLDSIFSLFVTAAMISFFFAYMEDKTRKRTGFLALFGVFCGLAFLTKGFVTFAIPVAAIIPFLIWEGRWKKLFGFSWVPIIIALLVILPWAVAIHLRESDFWRYFFWEEHIKRFMSENPQHPEAFWFYIPIIAGGALPWTVLLPAAVPGLKGRGLKDPLIRFAICWLLFPFFFFSASYGKLGTYILPCFPPLAILIAVGLLNYFKQKKSRTFKFCTSSLGCVIGVFAVTLVLSQVTDFLGFRAYGPAETWKWVFGTIGLLTWAVLLFLAAKAIDFQKKLVLYCITPLLLMFSSHFVIPNQPMEQKAPEKFLLRYSHRICPDTVLVTDYELVSAVNWFYKRNNVFLFAWCGELNYGLSYEDSEHRVLTIVQLFRWIVNKGSGKESIILIVDNKHYMRYRHIFPKPLFEESEGNLVFVEF